MAEGGARNLAAGNTAHDLGMRRWWSQIAFRTESESADPAGHQYDHSDRFGQWREHDPHDNRISYCYAMKAIACIGLCSNRTVLLADPEAGLVQSITDFIGLKFKGRQSRRKKC